MNACRKLSVGVALWLFAALPVVARADGKDAPKPTVEGLQKALDDLRRDFDVSVQKNRKAQKETASLKQQLDRLEQSMDRVISNMDALHKEQVRVSSYFAPGQGGVAEAPTGGAAVPLTSESRLRTIEDRLREIDRRLVDQQRDIDDLKARNGRTSLTVDTGSFLLDNSRMARDAVFVINGTAYRVPALQTRTITGHQAGAFTYEVFVDGYLTGTGPITRTLRKDQVYRIWTY